MEVILLRFLYTCDGFALEHFRLQAVRRGFEEKRNCRQHRKECNAQHKMATGRNRFVCQSNWLNDIRNLFFEECSQSGIT